MVNLFWFLGLVILVVAGPLLSGCQLPVEPLISTNPTQALAEAVAKTNWIIALSIAGIAFSVMAWINGSKTAIGVLIGCAVALWLQVTVVRYASVLALVGLAAAIGLGIWTVFVKNRALKEIVYGIQDFKKTFPIGSESLHIRLKNQKKTTQKIVTQIKGKLPGKKV
jgi:hypothetical protein